MFAWLKGSSGPDAAVKAHVEKYLGPVSRVLEGEGGGVQVLLVENSQCCRMVTWGMSSKPLQAKNEAGTTTPVYSELMITLPPGKAEEWARLTLCALARYPFENNTFFFMGHSIANDRIVAGCPYDGFLFGPSVSTPEGFWIPKFGKKAVLFLSVYPLYRDELQYKLKFGSEALEQPFSLYGVTDVAPPRRTNTCQPKLIESEAVVDQAADFMTLERPRQAGEKLYQAAQLMVALVKWPEAMALGKLAQQLVGGELPAELAHLQQQGQGSVDAAFLAATERKLEGLDFPPLSASQLEGGNIVADGLECVVGEFFELLMKMSPQEWLAKVPVDPPQLLLDLLQIIRNRSEVWQQRVGWCAVWSFVELTRGQKEACEVAYRAVLTRGGQPGLTFRGLTAMRSVLRGFEDITVDRLSGGDPLKRQAAISAYWLLGELVPEVRHDVHALALDGRVAVLGMLLVPAIQGVMKTAQELKLMA